MIEMHLSHLSNFETVWQQQYFHAYFNDLLYAYPYSAWSQYAKH